MACDRDAQVANRSRPGDEVGFFDPKFAQEPEK
jgi:hypothetical protein